MKSPEKNKNERPKIGLALSGASGRAVTHIGVLEALRDAGIPVDYITACSSATIIAGSYACGTMEQLKAEWLALDKKFFFSHLRLDTAGRGLLGTDRLADWARPFTKGLRFEDVAPSLGFVCTDIKTGEAVTLCLGDLLKATRASCAVPGLFEPVEWGSRVLVDGGLSSIIPTIQAKEMGADIVIGVDIAATKYMFPKRVYALRKGYNYVKNSLPVRAYVSLHKMVDWALTRSIDYIFYTQSDFLDDAARSKGNLFSTLGESLDIFIAQSDKRDQLVRNCDVMISPRVKDRGKMDFEDAGQMMSEGRRAVTEALPKIQKLIGEWQEK